MKKKVLVFVLSGFLFFSLSFASLWEGSPNDIISNMKDNDIQNTALDKSIGGNGQGVKKSLEDVKQGSTGYIQWMGYIGLAMALILIIYNGIMILANFGDDNKLSKAKKRFISLIVGVILLYGAIEIIKIIVGLVGSIF